MGCDLIFGGRKPQGKNYGRSRQKTPQEIVYDPSKWDIDGDTLIKYTGNSKNVIIPDGVTKIEECALNDCDKLKSVRIPTSVIDIAAELNPPPETVFYNGTLAQWCAVDNSTDIMGTERVILIGESNLDIKTLTTLKIPDGVTKIGMNAFQECISLESVEFSASVESINPQAFYKCSNLKSLTIPASVTSIDEYAFEDCDTLESVTYGGTKEQWDKIEIDEYDNLKNCVIHCTDGDITAE